MAFHPRLPLRLHRSRAFIGLTRAEQKKNIISENDLRCLLWMDELAAGEKKNWYNVKLSKKCFVDTRSLDNFGALRLICANESQQVQTCEL